MFFGAHVHIDSSGSGSSHTFVTMGLHGRSSPKWDVQLWSDLERGQAGSKAQGKRGDLGIDPQTTPTPQPSKDLTGGSAAPPSLPPMAMACPILVYSFRTT